MRCTLGTALLAGQESGTHRGAAEAVALPSHRGRQLLPQPRRWRRELPRSDIAEMLLRQKRGASGAAPNNMRPVCAGLLGFLF